LEVGKFQSASNLSVNITGLGLQFEEFENINAKYLDKL
jgi:hypothetical protein